MGSVPPNNSKGLAHWKVSAQLESICVFLFLLAQCYETALSGTFLSVSLPNMRLLCTK